MRIVCLSLAVCLSVAFAQAATAPKLGTAGLDNLGDSLLDGDLARALSAPKAPPAKKAKPAAQPAPDWLLNPAAIDRLMTKDVGEDVGKGSPLASVVSGMRQAEGLIRDDADNRLATPVQKQVVADLERLIVQMEKQCASCNKSGSKQGEQKKQVSKRSQPKQGGECDKPGDKPGKPSQKPGKKANQSGTTSLAGAPQAATPEGQQQLIKDAWGHLPERVREQMLQGADSEFLPEYREELQQYFRRLAERSARDAR